MIDENSPIHDFYPDEFLTDLNGKKNNWESVVLIPFIDEKRLLEAIATKIDRLTAEVCIFLSFMLIHFYLVYYIYWFL